jgi:hypothetical protein
MSWLFFSLMNLDKQMQVQIQDASQENNPSYQWIKISILSMKLFVTSLHYLARIRQN